jgi:integrase
LCFGIEGVNMGRMKGPFVLYSRKIKRANGKILNRWYYSLNPECGLPISICQKEHRKSTGKGTRNAAIDWLVSERIPQLKLEMQSMKNEPAKVTLKDFLNPFYIPGMCPHMNRKKADGNPISERFAIDQRRRLERYIFTDHICELELNQIRPGDVEDWKQRLLHNKVGIRTINLSLSALRASLREGIHRGDLNYDPTQIVSKIKDESSSYGIFSVEELKYLFVDSPNLWNYTENNHGSRFSGQFRNDLAFAHALLFASSGERPSALLEIRWSDLSDGQLLFRKEILKTGATRTIPLLPRLWELLESIRKNGIYTSNDDYVFSTSSGVRFTRTWYRKTYERMLRNSKLPILDPQGNKRVFYSFKHSLITHLIDAGADELFVREYVGHSHSYGQERVLTRVQSVYKQRQTDKLAVEVLPYVENIFT